MYMLNVCFRDRSNVRTACVLIWPDGLPTVSEYDYA